MKILFLSVIAFVMMSFSTSFAHDCDDGSGSCWDSCPFTFSSCAEKCGGGEQCWDKCPFTFSHCAESCGAGRGCWEKCPFTFSSCAEHCGKQKLGSELELKFLIQHNERLQKEMRQ